jgi:hypothetical protein
MVVVLLLSNYRELGYLSQYSDGVRKGELGSIPGRSNISLFSIKYRLSLGSNRPPKYFWDLFSRRLKRQGRETENSLPPTSEVKNIAVILTLPQKLSWRSA